MDSNIQINRKRIASKRSYQILVYGIQLKFGGSTQFIDQLKQQYGIVLN